MADLIRQIPMPTTCHFLRSTRCARRTPGSVRTDIVYSAEIPYEGRHILLLEGVVDTGITLNFLVDHIRERQPASLKVCALVDKPRERKIDVHPDWAAFSLQDPLPRRPLHRRLRPRLGGRLPGLARPRHHPSARPSLAERTVTLSQPGDPERQRQSGRVLV